MASEPELPTTSVTAGAPAGAGEKTGAPAAKGSSRGKMVGVAIAAIAAASGALYYVHSLSFEDTDDAQVDGDISAVSPKVSGQLTAVHVVENQRVKAGDLIAEIEPADFEVAVAQVKQTEAQLAEAHANETLANTELERSKKLVASGSISSAELDQRVATADAARAATRAAEQARMAASERINQARSHLVASASRAV
jgi:membrane fusion protein (multidrug efflux system)